MKLKKFIIFSILLSTISCATSFPSVCRHNALYTASIMQDKYPTKIIEGRVYKEKRHAQTKAFIDKEWKWIIKTQDGAEIGQQEHFMTEIQEFGLIGFADFLTRK